MNKAIELVIGGVIFVVTVAVVTLGISYVNNQKNEMLSKDLQMAVERGIDPMAIRCAYAGGTDNICLIYTSAKARQSVEIK